MSVPPKVRLNFVKPVHVGEELTAESKEIHHGKSTGLYQVEIRNQHQHLVALFKGTCFRSDKKLVADDLQV